MLNTYHGTTAKVPILPCPKPDTRLSQRDRITTQSSPSPLTPIGGNEHWLKVLLTIFILIPITGQASDHELVPLPQYSKRTVSSRQPATPYHRRSRPNQTRRRRVTRPERRAYSESRIRKSRSRYQERYSRNHDRPETTTYSKEQRRYRRPNSSNRERIQEKVRGETNSLQRKSGSDFLGPQSTQDISNTRRRSEHTDIGHYRRSSESTSFSHKESLRSIQQGYRPPIVKTSVTTTHPGVQDNTTPPNDKSTEVESDKLHDSPPLLLSPSKNKGTAATNQSENLQVIPTGKENRTSTSETPDLNKTEEASLTDSDQQNDTPTPDSLYPFRKIESISPLDIKRKDLSEAQPAHQEDDFLTDRKWKTQLFNWKPSGNHHFPLYFDDMPLERYGHHLGLLQPFWSAGQFVTQALLIPYTTGLEAPLKKRYALGYARPGDPVPRLWYQIPFSMRSAVSGATALSTNIMGIP